MNDGYRSGIASYISIRVPGTNNVRDVTAQSSKNPFYIMAGLRFKGFYSFLEHPERWINIHCKYCDSKQ